MSSKTKLLKKLNNIASDKNWTLADAEQLLTQHGFTMRNTGSSHRVWSHPSLASGISLAAHGKDIKPCYIKIIREALAEIQG
ncbi:MAG: type II toxin-antitoxin system HicA family toxin [Prosthecobacter sp.]|nr:type II toxin-antitoxin system HicA family toxin [Prosthecobacter sp.]